MLAEKQPMIDCAQRPTKTWPISLASRQFPLSSSTVHPTGLVKKVTSGLAPQVGTARKSLRERGLGAVPSRREEKKPVDFPRETLFQIVTYYSYGASCKGPRFGGTGCTIREPSGNRDRNATLDGKQRNKAIATA
jgi:hypothetical protein